MCHELKNKSHDSLRMTNDDSMQVINRGYQLVTSS